ncbi:hypothetical protein ASG77_11830 [Arthrobacter sp. Soil762]|nr:hypothetical protein ASG77_11830 [Arthrobacter sp. Soil762]
MTVSTALPSARRSPPAQLLQEDRGALRRPKQQDGVHLRQVQAFVEKVDGKNAVDLPLTEAFQRSCSVGIVGASIDGDGNDPGTVEHLGHVMGVLD